MPVNEATCMIISENHIDDDLYVETSVSNITLSVASKVFVVSNTSKFYVGQNLYIISRGTPTSYGYGTVTTFNTSTGDLTVNVTSFTGTGAHADWDIYGIKWYGGSWLTSLPLDNLEDFRLGKKARSTNAAITSTIFRCDMGQRLSADIFTLLRHNFSVGTEIRWRILDVNAAGTFSVVYDSAKIRAFPATEDFGDLPWGVFNWGGTDDDTTNELQVVHLPKEMAVTTSTTTNTIGTGNKTFNVVSVSDLYEGQDVVLRDAANPFNCMLGFISSISGMTIIVTVDAIEGSGAGITSWVVTGLKYSQTPVTVKGRFLQVDIFEANNVDGFLELGRVVLGQAWRPTVNMNFGWDIKYVDESTMVRSLGGQPYFRTKRKYRQLNFNLDYIPRDEMFKKAFKADREKGISVPILVVVDPSDNTNLADLTIYGTLQNTSPIGNPRINRYHNKNFSVVEWP